MKVKKIHNHGNHLIFDAHSNATLNDKKFIEKFLLELTKKIKMKNISKPLVIQYKAKEKSESGVTGTIILAESSIQIHTYPNKKWLALDIFSCKEFEKEKTIKYLLKKLQIINYKTKFIKRGFLQ
jgi:S-adenosylmethionine decarboxylase